MGRYFADDWKKNWEDKPRRRRRVRLIPLLLMAIGGITVLVAAARYAIVPLLVWLGGVV